MSKSDRCFHGIMAGLTGLAALILLLPLVIVVLSSFDAVSYLRFPPRSFSLAWYHHLFTLQQFVEPLWISLQLAVWIAAIVTLCGTLAAFALQRAFVRGGSVLAGLFLAPMVLPSLVTGLSMLVLFSLFNINNGRFTLGLGHVVVTMPFVLQMLSGVVRSTNPRLELAAMTLGAPPRVVLWRVILPAVRPGMAAAAIVAFALSFDEFIVSVLLARGGTTTFPIELFQFMRFSVSPVVAAISTLMIIFTLIFIIVFHRFAGIETLLGLPVQRKSVKTRKLTKF